jgi:cob(I)alamin adenosyltransferase
MGETRGYFCAVFWGRAMEHQVVLDELRDEAQRYIDAAQRASEPQQKRKLVLAASALFQLAEQLESGTALTKTHVKAYREMLADAIDDELRKAIDTLLSGPVTS